MIAPHEKQATLLGRTRSDHRQWIRL